MITHNGKTYNISYNIFDAHTHAFPDAIAASTMNRLGDGLGIPYYHDGTYAGLCNYEQKADKVLLLPIATKPKQAHSVNTWAAQHQNSKLLAFGSVHPDSDHLADELDEAKQLGLLGIKLHPEYQQFYVDEERNLRLYEMIFARGMHLVFHAGVDLGYDPPVHCTPQMLGRVLDAFPDHPIIAAHMAGHQMEEQASELLAGRRNLWMDMAYVTETLTSEQLARLSRTHGIDRILFATDAPWTDFDSAVNAVFAAGFDEAELRAVFYDNAAALLGI